MENNAYATHGFAQLIDIAQVPFNKMDFPREVVGHAARMHLCCQIVVHPNFMTAIEQRIRQMRSDETRTTRDQNLLCHYFSAPTTLVRSLSLIAIESF